MVCPTRLQSTPRREKYSSTKARRKESTHDHTLRRGFSFGGSPSRGWMRVLLFHEVVADHVHHHHMKIFDAAGVCVGDLNIELRQGAQPSALAARESDSPAADGIAVFHGAQDIGRVAGTADGD